MSKIALIIKREYLSRVRKKSFIILSFITPVLFSALIFMPIWLSGSSDSSDEEKNLQKSVLITDVTGRYWPVYANADTDRYRFFYDTDPDWQKYHTNEYDIYAYMVISEDLKENPDAVKIYFTQTFNQEDKQFIQKPLEEFLTNEQLSTYNIPHLQEIIHNSQVYLTIPTEKVDEKSGESKHTTDLDIIISIISAFLIYMFIFMYSSQVMHSVLEEKNNRIVEVIISSVKPAQLMAGKIIGTILVAFTQFFFWFALTIFITIGIGFLSGIGSSDYMLQFKEIMQLLDQGNVSFILCWFLVFFIGGYLLYASFFAAVGSIVESGADSQQFILPVTIPLIFALYVAIYCFQNPDSSLVFWSSLIPFTSPIVMVARLPFDVPAWQLFLSLAILIASFYIFVRIAAKIYKTGILMYGKKIGYKEIRKWLHSDR